VKLLSFHQGAVKLQDFIGVRDPISIPRVGEKMREILFSDTIPAYLDGQAKIMFKEAQAAAIEAGLKSNNFALRSG